MTELSGRDVKAVLELVGEANDTETLDEFRSFLLPALRRLVPADFASYNEVLDGGRVLAAIVQPELPAELIQAWAQHAFGNPLVARYARTRDGRPYRFSDLMSDAELRELPVFTQFFSRIGVRHQIAFALPSPPALVRGVALSRVKRDFTDREREMLDLARPYLVQAYRNAVLRGRLTATVENLAGALEQLEHPAMIVDRSGIVVYATPRAGEMLELLGGDTGRPLPVELQPLLAADSQPALVRLPNGVMLAHALNVPRVSDRVIVLETGQPLADDALSGFGLTPREIAVLREFASGRSPVEVASRLAISVRTVHKHTQHINAKLGTRDRAQAVATALAALRAGT